MWLWAVLLVTALAEDVQIVLHAEQDFARLAELKIQAQGVHHGERTVEANVSAEQLRALKAAGFDVRPPSTAVRDSVAQIRATRGDSLGTYHTQEELEHFLKDMAARFPTITSIFNIGKSVQGRDLWGIRITDNPGVNEPMEPEFKYVGNMHGDEVVGREMLLYLVELLCTTYDTDPDMKDLIDTTDIYIVPTMNPDGFFNHKRENAHGVDLNRNFPDQYTSPPVGDGTQGREPEVVAMMNWIRQHTFVLSANLHGGAEVANYPFDGLPDGSTSYWGRANGTPDNSLFVSLAQTYAQNHATMSRSREFSGGITNGAHWYTLYGGMQDWNYLWGNAFELTLELSNDKWPQPDKLPQFWEQNRRAMLAYMKKVHIGVNGLVTDAATGQPLAANIEVAEIGHAVRTDPETGDYFRLLMPGTYEITASASGYFSQTVSVTVNGNGAIRNDFALQSTSAGAPSPSPAAARPNGGTSSNHNNDRDDGAPTTRPSETAQMSESALASLSRPRSASASAAPPADRSPRAPEDQNPAATPTSSPRPTITDRIVSAVTPKVIGIIVGVIAGACCFAAAIGGIGYAIWRRRMRVSYSRLALNAEDLESVHDSASAASEQDSRLTPTPTTSDDDDEDEHDARRHRRRGGDRKKKRPGKQRPAELETHTLL